MVLKKDRPKKLKSRPKREKKRPSMLGKVVVLDGKMAIDRRTGLNRDIPMGGGGGSSNLMANLARQGLAVSQPQPSIQTPDQFKLAQDITTIKSQQADIQQAGASIAKEQASIKQELGAQAEERKRKERSDKGILRGPRAKLSGQEKMVMTPAEIAQQESFNKLEGPEETYILKKSAGGRRVLMKKTGPETMTSAASELQPPPEHPNNVAPLEVQPDPLKPKKINATPTAYHSNQAPLAQASENKYAGNLGGMPDPI